MERDHKRGGPLESSHPTCRAIMRVHHVKVALLERLLHLSPEPDVTTKAAGSYLCYHVAVNTTASKRLYLVLHECAIVWALGGRPHPRQHQRSNGLVTTFPALVRTHTAANQLTLRVVR